MSRLTSALLLVSTALLLPTLSAQVVESIPANKGNCCPTMSAQRLAADLADWAQLGRYHDDDVKLLAAPAPAGRVIFMGDSITDGWNLATFFPGKPYVDRGISGQITSQMLLRMFPDVLALRPAAMIVLAGTNDIAGNNGPETLETIENNLQAMTELAQAHHVKVILCSLTPISDYTPSQQSAHRPPADILKLNAWLRNYAAAAGATFADYYGALVDAQGMLKNGLSHDGLHPNAAGYALLAPVASRAIEKALAP